MIAARGIGVHFGGVTALSGVDLSVSEGEVVALLGDTGAGKSTLLQVLGGARIPDAGTLEIDGREVVLRSPRDAARCNVQMLYQDLALVGGRSVAENLALGHEPVRRFGFLDRPAMRAQAERQLPELPFGRAVERLSGGQRQLVALARASLRVHNGGVLLLDEPTAALGEAQIDRLQALISQLGAAGVAIVLATHNLPLAFAVAGRTIVLNRGRKVADVPTAATDHEQVLRWLTGSLR